MNPNDTLEMRLCVDCGAAVHADADKCWLCGRANPGASGHRADVVQAEVIRRGGSGKLEWTASSLLILVALVVVNVGVWMIEPGIGLLMTLILVPAAVATTIRAAKQRGKGKQMSWGERALTFFLSAAASVGILAMLMVAAFVAFFIYCVVAFRQGGGF